MDKPHRRTASIQACKVMGAGRSRKGEAINLAVGIVLKAKVGSEVEGGSPVATIYADMERDYVSASDLLAQAITYSQVPVAVPPVIRAHAK